MKFNRNQAKELTNARELEMYDSAQAPQLDKLSVKELKDLVKRSRTLRDKLRDVKRSQVRSQQSKTAARGAAPAERSAEKADLFAEVHDIFAARLEKVEAGEAKAKADDGKKPTKTDKNIETRGDRTAAKQALTGVKKKANAPASRPAGKARNDDAKPGKKSLASATSANAPGKVKTSDDAVDGQEQSTAGTGKSSGGAANTGERGKIDLNRISRSGRSKKMAHISATNKRNQARRDSK